MAKDVPHGWTLGELAPLLGGELDGPADLRIERPIPAGQSDPAGLSFAENDTFLKKVAAGGVGAVLARPGEETYGVPAIRVAHPRQSFGRFLAICQRALPLNEGVHPSAVVSDTANIDPTASIGPFVVVEAGAVIGAGARVFPFAYIGEDCVIGAGTTVNPHAVLYQGVKIGQRSIIHAGVVLGADGFGFMWDGKKQNKIPQVGFVEIGDDVEVGANTTIDRATAGSTSVGRGTKLDNLVMIGHNSSVGEDTVIAACCGISGSTHIGNRVTFAGQVATVDHVKVGDDVTLGGRTGVMKDLPQPGVYWGTPARPYVESMKNAVLGQKMPEVFERLRKLEKRLEELETK